MDQAKNEILTGLPTVSSLKWELVYIAVDQWLAVNPSEPPAHTALSLQIKLF